MDSQFGIQGKDFVILVADASSAYSILKFKVCLDWNFKDDVDKIISIDNNKLMSLGGPVGDRV
jgi:20S proteasome alpha/beta subunit